MYKTIISVLLALASQYAFPAQSSFKLIEATLEDVHKSMQSGE
ncbi:MAG: hypothetical protein ACI9FB_003896, partial [Candidatus Azotimanducaceae bacterium]